MCSCNAPHSVATARAYHNYVYAHTRTGAQATTTTQRSRTRHHSLQARHKPFPSAFSGPFHRWWRQFHHCEDYHSHSCLIWLILINLLIVVSVNNCIAITTARPNCRFMLGYCKTKVSKICLRLYSAGILCELCLVKFLLYASSSTRVVALPYHYQIIKS